MKTAFAFIGVCLLLAGSLLADPIIVKQRALELRNQNNVQQGVTSPSQPAQPAQPGQPAPTPGASAAPTPIQLSIAKLRGDLMAIKAGSPVTAAQKQKIATDLIATAQGTSKPSQATAAALANSLAAAFAEKPLSDKDCSRLLSDLAAVLNPAKIQASQMYAIDGDIQAIFQANGMARKDAVKIVDQVKAVAAETQK
jgi:hypothetical protein